ncbi:unnamed protein product [Cyprideis torosa]|uniref:Glycosyl transferase family 51 domain-containing protein n=1 Tax=Cyprideis torosa TaxID=163714 RepID=A0A7R8WUQ2_9CRUS|nr:unnamed protein product [Cyprideis torosa]CAG0910665.1 unnamed protein product [Cyprideis torosa]
MASRSKKKTTKTTGNKTRASRARGVSPVETPFRWLFRQFLKLLFVLALLGFAVVCLFALINPPTTHTMWSEGRRLGTPVEHEWVSADEIAPVMLRSAVAAEDANFCRHWGFDMDAIRYAIAEGARRGGSTISQQVTKNVFLWQGRSWLRKALEALITPVVEIVWSKRRILEVYLNVAEFDEGVFGIEAAAQHYFRVGADQLDSRQASLLATVLPNPKQRDAAHPTGSMERRARSIRSGAATIEADGRSDCFE